MHRWSETGFFAKYCVTAVDSVKNPVSSIGVHHLWFFLACLFHCCLQAQSQLYKTSLKSNSLSADSSIKKLPTPVSPHMISTVSLQSVSICNRRMSSFCFCSELLLYFLTSSCVKSG